MLGNIGWQPIITAAKATVDFRINAEIDHVHGTVTHHDLKTRRMGASHQLPAPIHH